MRSDMKICCTSPTGQWAINYRLFMYHIYVSDGRAYSRNVYICNKTIIIYLYIL